jgi:hypothetical protein
LISHPIEETGSEPSDALLTSAYREDADNLETGDQSSDYAGREYLHLIVEASVNLAATIQLMTVSAVLKLAHDLNALVGLCFEL